MIGAVILVGVVLAMCAWMAYGEESNWVRGATRNLAMIVGFVAVGFVIFWVAQAT